VPIKYHWAQEFQKTIKRSIVLLTVVCFGLSSTFAMDKPEKEGKMEVVHSSSMSHPSSERKVVRILSVDGGGIRGILPITVLEGIEEHLQAEAEGEEVRLAEYFDIMAGTSTGGIITLGLNAGKSTTDLVRLYLDEGKKIFAPVSAWGKVKSYTGPKYDARALEEVLQNQLGDKWLNESISHVVIPADNLGQKCAYLFDSQQARLPSHNFKMRDVARATSAAPTYFGAATIKDKKGLDEHTFLDGGVFANDPTFEAVQAAEKEYPGCDLYIVSLGTGEEPRRFGDLSLKNGGKIKWASQIADELMTKQQDRHLIFLEALKESMKQQERNVEYNRIQLSIPEHLAVMDKAENIPSLRQAGMSLLNPQNSSLSYNMLMDIVRHLHDYKAKQLQ
jgi:patatin-like phospholipase/acyl hydrolase